MKINFLAEKISELTGGCIYDGGLYRRLAGRFGDDLKLFDYAYFGDDFAFLDRDFLRYGMNFRKHAEELLDCDYLVLNTTMYQKFLLFPWRLKRKSRCRVVGITHHLDYLAYTDRTRRIRKRLLLSLLGHCDRVVSPNRCTIDCLKPFGLSERAMLVEMYLDNTVHESAGPKEKLVSFVGTVEPRKGVAYGIRAFAEFSRTHPDYRFTAAGSFMTGYSDAAYCRSLLRLVKDLGVEEKVTFPGRIGEEEKKELYERSRIFLFPSLTEGYGWVMAEAMGYGMPVVAFNNSAMPYTVNETNGILVPDKDVKAMADALRRLADDPDLYRRLSAGAAETVRALPDREAVEAQYDRLMDLMEERRL